MRVGGREFKIKRIEQHHVAANMFGTVIECTGDNVPMFVDIFMPITDTGIPALEGQLCYLGKFDNVNGKMLMRFILRDNISRIEMEE